MRLGDHAIEFECGLVDLPLLDPSLEVSIKLNDALLNRPVQTLEPIVSTGDLGLQRGATALEGLILGLLALDQRIKNTREAVASEQVLFQVVDDQPVEFRHRHVPSPTSTNSPF